MKNKIFGMLLVGSMSLFVVGCENKNSEVDKTPKIICSQTMGEDGFKTTSTATMIINSEKYVKEYVSESKIVIDNQETFNFYVEAIKNDSDMELDDDVDYKYNIDEDNKTITTTMKVVLSDERYNEATEEEREEMKAKTIVESAEKSGANCEFKNITRGDLGL